MMSRELIHSVTLKDFELEYFSGTGAGGQHRNKHQNCVRLTHRESGARSTGTSSRSRKTNLREAFRAIVNSDTFKSWHKMEIAERILNGQSIRDKVNQMMRPENLKIETIKS